MTAILRRAVVGIALALPVASYFPPAPIAAAADARVQSHIYPLIVSLNSSSAQIDGVKADEALEVALGIRSRVVEDLLAERPVNVAELRAKLLALLPIFAEGQEQALLSVIRDDAQFLIERGVR